MTFNIIVFSHASTQQQTFDSMASHMASLDLGSKATSSNPFATDSKFKAATGYDPNVSYDGTIEEQKRQGQELLAKEEIAQKAISAQQKVEETYADTTSEFSQVVVGDTDEYIKNLYGGKGRWEEVPERRTYKDDNCQVRITRERKEATVTVTPRVSWETTTHTWTKKYSILPLILQFCIIAII